MEELKRTGESLAACFKTLAELKAEITLQDDSTQVSNEFPCLQLGWSNLVGEVPTMMLH